MSDRFLANADIERTSILYFGLQKLQIAQMSFVSSHWYRIFNALKA